MSTTAIVTETESKNMRLIGHHDLGGFGNGGEGMGLQKTKDGRRVLYIAHECAPKNFSVLDVTDPSKPHLITQTELPHKEVRSNSLVLQRDFTPVNEVVVDGVCDAKDTRHNYALAGSVTPPEPS